MNSHYATGYGVFTNAEILILDDANLLDVPTNYNKHVILHSSEDVVDEVYS